MGHGAIEGGARMIRRATDRDLDAVERAYDEHFRHEEIHGAFTVFKKGVYPTRRDAQSALDSGTLYVYEEDGDLLGSIIVDAVQPEEYRDITWGEPLCEDEVMVIHLLMVRPCAAGRGIGSALVRYAVELARARPCRALRLDTGSQNVPAVSLYKKSGFRIVAAAPMKVGGALAHREHLFLERPL